MKADYIEGFLNDLDLCVMAGYYSHSVNQPHTKHLVNEFLMGVVQEKENYKMIPICRVNKGLTRNDLFDMQMILSKNYIKTDKMTKN